MFDVMKTFCHSGSPPARCIYTVNVLWSRHTAFTTESIICGKPILSKADIPEVASKVSILAKTSSFLAGCRDRRTTVIQDPSSLKMYIGCFVAHRRTGRFIFPVDDQTSIFCQMCLINWKGRDVLRDGRVDVFRERIWRTIEVKKV